MIYLSGVTSDRDEPALIAAGMGLMLGPHNSYHLRADRYPYFAADNGCFADKWVEDIHLAWLDRLPRERCLFAVAPDVYPDAQATLERSLEYFDLLREMGFPVALVAQDHAEKLELPWDDFDCLMIGGEKKDDARKEWKLSIEAEGLVHEARSKGKWVHMGRVNSITRMARARSMGCHSADGTFIKYRRRKRKGETDERDGRGAIEIGQWLAWLRANPELPFRTFESPSLPVHKEALGER